MLTRKILPTLMMGKLKKKLIIQDSEDDDSNKELDSRCEVRIMEASRKSANNDRNKQESDAMTMSPTKKKAKESFMTATEMDPANQEDDNDDELIMTDVAGRWSINEEVRTTWQGRQPVKM